MKKILGFLFLVSLVGYHVGGRLMRRNPGSDHAQKFGTAARFQESAGDASGDIAMPILVKNPDFGLFVPACNPGYHLTATLTKGESICLKDGSPTPGAYDLQ